MVYDSRTVETALLKKGFKMEPKDHRWYVFYRDGIRTNVRTMVSHNKQEINDYLIGCMKKQLHLSKKEFEDLVKCPLTYEKYIEILLEQGILVPQ